MSQIFDPVPPGFSNAILCCYVNATSKIQIVRITNIQNWYFERVIFPGQRLIFEALPEALLEIHSGMMASAILSDTIPCDRLRIEAELENSLEASSDVFFKRSEIRSESITDSLVAAVTVPAE